MGESESRPDPFAGLSRSVWGVVGPVDGLRPPEERVVEVPVGVTALVVWPALVVSAAVAGASG